MSEEVSNVTHVIICLSCRTLCRFFTSDFPHRHKLTLHLSLPHFWFYYSLTHLLPVPHLPFLTLRCKCWLSCIDISPWQMKCDRRSLARTSILMISVICQDWERQQEGWENRSMVMMRMEDGGFGMYPGTGRKVGKPGFSWGWTNITCLWWFYALQHIIKSQMSRQHHLLKPI